MINKALLTLSVQCEELQLFRLSERFQEHYSLGTTENLIKLFFRCKEFFLIRLRVIKLLTTIHERESVMSRLQALVRELNEGIEERQDTLEGMVQGLKASTKSAGQEIVSFLSDYRKYFGKTFIYEGTVSNN